MNIVNFKSPSGDDMIVIPRAEYEKLAQGVMSDEDIKDAAAVLNFRERMANGAEELTPAAVVESLMLGHIHPIRIWRDHRGLKARELAEIVGITPNFLSMIEHGKKDGSLKLYIKLSHALNVTLDDLVPDNIG